MKRLTLKNNFVLVMILCLYFSSFIFFKLVEAQESISRSLIEKKSSTIEFVTLLRNEVLKNFTLMGEPITPVALKAMEQWASDVIPGIITIDLLATINSNQFYGDFTTTINNATGDATWYMWKDKENGGSFDYTFIGKIDDDKCILVTRSNSEGTYTSANLIVLKIEIDKCLDLDCPKFSDANNLKEQDCYTKPRYRLLAKKVLDSPLEIVGDFELKNNSLRIIRTDLNKELVYDLSTILGL